MTAVEWLVKIYLQTNKIDSFDIEQAKEMEKQMVIDIVEKSRATGLTAEYLLLTYGSKGSDDKKEPKDVVLGYKTSLEAQMLDSQIPQKEISDEEIEKASKYIQTTNPDLWTFKIAWKAGAKWYREQLKKK